jgi:hypothetical protein
MMDKVQKLSGSENYAPFSGSILSSISLIRTVGKIFIFFCAKKIHSIFVKINLYPAGMRLGRGM